MNIGFWVYEQGDLSLSTIQSLYLDRERYRVSTTKYDAGSQFCGTMKRGKVIVYRGACDFTVENKTFFCSEGAVLEEHDSCNYSVQVSDTGCQLVYVCYLPVS